MTLNYEEPRVAKATYGRELLDELPMAWWRQPIVLTQPEPWELVKDQFHLDTTQMHMVKSMEHSRVQEVTRGFSAGSAVFGIGGGMALDHAKYVSWKTGAPLVLVPTILSVDAAYTKAVGVREGSKVRYVGEVYPDRLLVDYGLLQQAPKVLNLSGVGDLLSIFTALWDWKEAGHRLGEFYDPAVAAESQILLDRLIAGKDPVAQVSDEGLWLISELYVGEVRLCEMVGNSRPEEGSEHYLAYCLESMTRRAYIHGQLIGLCILIAGHYQQQDIGPIARFLEGIGLDCSLKAVGTSRQEMKEALLHMHHYVQGETQLLPGVFHFKKGIGSKEADRLLDELKPIIGE
jgi:glycerol dehydrogenase-like iron-containing ADH family enzyme